MRRGKATENPRRSINKHTGLSCLPLSDLLPVPLLYFPKLTRKQKAEELDDEVLAVHSAVDPSGESPTTTKLTYSFGC